MSATTTTTPEVTYDRKVIDTVNGFEIVDYSPKAIVIKGRKTSKEELASWGISGKFNRNLSMDGSKFAGWIFPKSQQDKVVTALVSAVA